MKVRSLSALVVSSILFIASCKLDPPVYPGQPGYVDTAPKSSTGGSSSSGSSTGSGSSSGSTTGTGSSGSGTGSGSTSGWSTGSGSSSGTGTGTSNSALTGTWVLSKTTDLTYMNGTLVSSLDDPSVSIYTQITLDDKAKTGTYETIGGTD